MNSAKDRYPSLFNYNELKTDLFKKQLKDYINESKNKLFNNFKDIYFYKCSSNFYYHIFKSIKEKDNIYFEDCHFFFSDITHKGNSIFKDSKVTFKNCIFNSSWDISSDVNYPNIKFIFNECKFLNTLGILYIDSHIEFNDCSFANIELKNCNIKNNIFRNKKDSKNNINNFIIDNCTFEKSFKLNYFNIEEFNCSNSLFHNKFEFKNNTIKKFYIHNSNFEEISDMFSSKFIQFKISKSIFNDFTGFENCIFGTSNNLIEELSEFEYVTFKDILTLRNTEFLSGLDIENINLQNNANFLKTQVELQNTPRETFRLIKHSFDKVGNIIEANNFYSLEMNKKEEELKNNFPKHFLEWLVFKVHDISSKHSQNWFLSLYWLITITFIYSHFKIFLCQENTEYFILPFVLNVIIFIYILLETTISKNISIITNIISVLAIYLIYSFSTKDIKLKEFSNNMNPFSIMTGHETLTLSTLIYKVIIAYLIYQLIVSVRQNTRRK